MSKLLNTSGLKPLGRAVLIRHHRVEALKSRGLIAIPDVVATNMQMLEQEAVVVAIGPTCWHDEPQPRCAVGDHVVVTKFAGFLKKGADGEMYRLVNDKDIFCGVTAELPQTAEEPALPVVDDQPGATLEVANG